MIEDYLLPWPLPEKLKLKFLANSFKIGEHIEFEGFIVNTPNDKLFRELLERELFPKIGDFRIKGITPFPNNGYPVMPLVVPYWIPLKFSFGTVEGRIYDFSEFTPLKGRFLLVERAEKKNVEKYLIGDGSALDGGKIQKLFEFSFPDNTAEIMLSFFLSSGSYAGRIGGCTVTLIDAMSKYYASDFRGIEGVLGKISPMLTKNSFRVTLEYDAPWNISIRSSVKIKYSQMKSKKALNFYTTRSGREWEKSALTNTTVKMDKLIGSAELPFIPYKEESIADAGELEEYSMDIASYVIQRHIKEPEIDIETVEKAKDKIVRKIDSEFPLLSEAMRVGVLMDIGDVNGFGEHVGRLVNAWSRLGRGDPVDNVLRIYTTLFERIEDALQERIKKEISAVGEKKRLEKIINRVLWELNVLRPEGWDFFYFQKKMEERGISKTPEKIFEELLKNGLIIEKKKNLFLGVSSI